MLAALELAKSKAIEQIDKVLGAVFLAGQDT